AGRARPGDHAARRRRRRRPGPARVRESQGGRRGRRRLARRRGEGDHLSHRPRELRQGQRGDGAVLQQALPRPRHGPRPPGAARRSGRGRVPPAPALKPPAGAPAPRAEERPVTALRGVGAALAERLAHLGVTRVADLLFLLPLRYEDRTRVTPLGALEVGTRAAVEGEIQLTEVTYRRRRQLLTRIADRSGMLTLRFFYSSASQQANLARGTRLRCFGEVRRGPLGLEMVHPEYRRLSQDGAPLEETLTPIYPLTEGVPQGRLRALIGEAL